MRAFGIIVLAAWFVVLAQMATSPERKTGPFIAFVALFGSIALAVANAAGATS